jgi:hypothetical protein
MISGAHHPKQRGLRDDIDHVCGARMTAEMDKGVVSRPDVCHCGAASGCAFYAHFESGLGDIYTHAH